MHPELKKIRDEAREKERVKRDDYLCSNVGHDLVGGHGMTIKEDGSRSRMYKCQRCGENVKLPVRSKKIKHPTGQFKKEQKERMHEE